MMQKAGNYCYSDQRRCFDLAGLISLLDKTGNSMLLGNGVTVASLDGYNTLRF